ncbi:MAG TPA: hypothetical protein VGM54_13470 [Chthoniobacter sp.]|jgi:hypothetical protein
MKRLLILVPVLLGAMFVTGCAGTLADGSSSSAGSYDAAYDDSVARSNAQQDAISQNDWEIEQANEQSAATATQESDAATQETSDAAAAIATSLANP